MNMKIKEWHPKFIVWKIDIYMDNSNEEIIQEEIFLFKRNARIFLQNNEDEIFKNGLKYMLYAQYVWIW